MKSVIVRNPARHDSNLGWHHAARNTREKRIPVWFESGWGRQRVYHTHQ
jgi:hypothetical protein